MIFKQILNQEKLASEDELRSLRRDGFGAHMIFAMDPFRKNFDTQLWAMQNIARALFDDELVYDNKPYRKDW